YQGYLASPHEIEAHLMPRLLPEQAVVTPGAGAPRIEPRVAREAADTVARDIAAGKRIGAADAMNVPTTAESGSPFQSSERSMDLPERTAVDITVPPHHDSERTVVDLEVPAGHGGERTSVAIELPAAREPERLGTKVSYHADGRVASIKT